MHDNPYQPPLESPQYYTDDITTLPVGAIWRFTSRQGIVGCLVTFPMFLLRKFFKLRFPANHAACRVTELPAIAEDELPAEIRNELAPLESACRDAGLAHVRTFRAPWIGGKSGVFSLWLDPNGVMYCNLTRIHLRLGSIERSKTVLGCHSRLASGVFLHTAAVAPRDWIPELVPPNHDLLCLSPDTSPADVIQRHRQRLAGMEGIVTFNRETLIQEMIKASHETFDYLVAKGIYAPLSSSEVKRLQGFGQSASCGST